MQCHVFDEFNADPVKKLVTFNGRTLKQELKLFGEGKMTLNDNRVDWTNLLKNAQMYFYVPPKQLKRMLMQVENGSRYTIVAPDTDPENKLVTFNC